MYFEYGENEITYLRNKDKKLSEVIDQIGMIEREVDTDLFSAVVHHIIGQQISTKAQATIWQPSAPALRLIEFALRIGYNQYFLLLIPCVQKSFQRTFPSCSLWG